MKQVLVCIILVLSLSAFAQEKDKDKKPPTLKSILLEQLRTTHNQKEWFVPANTAVEGLTAEQASWQDGKGNHSIGQLANHFSGTRRNWRSSREKLRLNSAEITTKLSTTSTARSGPLRSSNSIRF
jgi:hypothetical protein